jgi:hypothetical protein
MGQVGLFSVIKWACFGLTKTLDHLPHVMEERHSDQEVAVDVVVPV